MLYCVSCNYGAVGIFSSIDKAKEMIFDVYNSLTFITQVFKNSDEKSKDNLVWIILYKDNDAYAYVSDNKKEVENAVIVFNKIGKLYEEEIDYLEQEIDVVAESITNLLIRIHQAKIKCNPDLINKSSDDNIIYYV